MVSVDCRNRGEALSGVLLVAQAAAQACDAEERCKGFQFCFRSTAQSSAAAARIRLKGAISGPLNITTAMFNPYCRC